MDWVQLIRPLCYAASGQQQNNCSCLGSSYPTQTTELPDANAQSLTHIGDRINDAAALAAAYLGISLQSSPSVALDASNVVLLNSSLSGVLAATTISKHTAATIRCGVAWACLYNAVLMPLAMGLGSPWSVRTSLQVPTASLRPPY